MRTVDGGLLVQDLDHTRQAADSFELLLSANTLQKSPRRFGICGKFARAIKSNNLVCKRSGWRLVWDQVSLIIDAALLACERAKQLVSAWIDSKKILWQHLMPSSHSR